MDQLLIYNANDPPLMDQLLIYGYTLRMLQSSWQHKCWKQISQVDHPFFVKTRQFGLIFVSTTTAGMFIGSQIGEMVSKRINEATFKTLTMLLIAVMGSRLLLNGLPPRHVGTVVCLIGTAAGICRGS